MANNVCAPSLSPPLSSTILVIPSELDVLPQEPTPDVVAIARRPPGSENEPKPTWEEFPKPIVLIIPAGIDIVNAIINFARDRDVSILVHHASGTISEVNLCNPVSPSNDLSFRGNLHMFSFTGFYTKSLSPLPPKNVPFSYFNIQFLKGTTLQAFGGLIGRKLIAAEPVHVMASILKKHEYQEVGYPITNPNTCADHYASFMSNAINTANHPGFSVGASTSSQMNVQPPAAPTDLNMLYWNNSTNQGDN